MPATDPAARIREIEKELLPLIKRTPHLETIAAVNGLDEQIVALRRERFQLEGELDRERRAWTPPLPFTLPEMPDARLLPAERAEALDLLAAMLDQQLRRVDVRLREAQRRESDANRPPFDGGKRARYDDAHADYRAARDEQIACERLRQQVCSSMRELEAVTI